MLRNEKRYIFEALEIRPIHVHVNNDDDNHSQHPCHYNKNTLIHVHVYNAILKCIYVHVYGNLQPRVQAVQ